MAKKGSFFANCDTVYPMAQMAMDSQSIGALVSSLHFSYASARTMIRQMQESMAETLMLVVAGVLASVCWHRCVGIGVLASVCITVKFGSGCIFSRCNAA